MKHWILSVALVCFGSAAHAAYFDNVFTNPSNAPISTKMLITSKGDLDGASAEVEAVYHQADPNDSLVPKSWQAYIPPESWGFGLGAGGNTDTGFIVATIDWNVAPQLLNPLTSALTKKGGNYAKVSQFVVQTNASGAATGQGINLGVGWKVNVVQDGSVPKFDELRAPPRYTVGYAWIIGKKVGAPTAKVDLTPNAYAIHGDLHGKLSLL